MIKASWPCWPAYGCNFLPHADPSRLYQRTNMNIGDLSRSGKCQCIDDDTGDILWLNKKPRIIGFVFKTVNRLLHSRSGSTCKDAQNTHSVWVNLVTQAFCHSL